VPRVSIKATELSNTDVDFIALVKRGANRIPFRLTKSEEEPMLDLFSAGRRFLMKGDAPRVIGIVYTQKADVAGITAMLKAEGIEVTALSKTEDAGVTTLLAKDADTADAILLKTGETTALVVGHLRKSLLNFDLGGSAYASDRHVSSIGTAVTMFKSELDTLLQKAETPADFASAVSKAATGFGSYVEQVARSLPTQALKMERALKAGTGNANGSAGSNQETGDGLGDRTNTRRATQKLENGTGDGFELGQGTGTNPSATADDASAQHVDAAPGGRVSGDSSGLPDALKASVAKLEAFLKTGQGLLKSMTINVTTDQSINGAEGAAGEGAAQAVDTRDQVSDDELTNTTQNVGKPKGQTLDHAGIPDKVINARKNEGDALDPDKLRQQQLPDGQSGAGAAQRDAQTLKSDAGVMQAIAALSKAVESGLAGVKKDFAAVSSRVEEVATMAKKTDAALNGTVFNEAGGDVVRQTRKSDNGDYAPPLLDTGYSRRGAA